MKDIKEKQIRIPIKNINDKKPERTKTNGSDKPLTACAIREITGIHDENLIQAILLSGASKREIQQAYDHCHGTPDTTLISRKPITERAKNLSDLIDFGNDAID